MNIEVFAWFVEPDHHPKSLPARVAVHAWWHEEIFHVAEYILAGGYQSDSQRFGRIGADAVLCIQPCIDLADVFLARPVAWNSSGFILTLLRVAR